MKKIKYKDRIIAEIYSYLDFEKYDKAKIEKNEGSFIKYLMETIPDTPVGYAGFEKKSYLKENLLRRVFGKDRVSLEQKTWKSALSLQFPIPAILSCIEEAIKKSNKTLSSKSLTRIFLFPTFRSFVKEKMFGVDGFTPYQGAINIYLHPKPKDQKEFLKEIKHTIAHEYSHSIRFFYFPIASFDTLRDVLVNEGLAEHFRIAVLGGGISPWAGALKKKEAREIFRKIKSFLDSKDLKIYQKVFFGNKEFPLWAGYAVGFQIIDAFFQKNPKIQWNEIIKMDSEQILQKSGWL